MARPREFDRDLALGEAIKVFSSHGYEGSSTDALLSAMGISRQSLYDTFGDKRRLFLAALARYNAASTDEIIGTMAAGASSLARLEAALVAFASRPHAVTARGCMGVMAVCEFGREDPDVTALTRMSHAKLRAAFVEAIDAGWEGGEIAADIDTGSAAEFLQVTLSGMKVAARGGASPSALRDIARMAIRSLR